MKTIKMKEDFELFENQNPKANTISNSEILKKMALQKRKKKKVSGKDKKSFQSVEKVNLGNTEKQEIFLSTLKNKIDRRVSEPVSFIIFIVKCL